MTTYSKGRVAKSLPGEVWVEYPPSPNIRVSNLGRVWAEDPFIPGRASTMPTFGGKDKKGYLRVNVRMSCGRRRQFNVHRLVAIMWLGMPDEPDMENMPKDGDWTNCRPENLLWGSRRDLAMVKRDRKKRAQSVKTTFSRSEGSPVTASPY